MSLFSAIFGNKSKNKSKFDHCWKCGESITNKLARSNRRLCVPCSEELYPKTKTASQIKEYREDTRIEPIVKKLVSSNDTTFGEGLTEILAISESDPLRLRSLREAIRRRSRKTEVLFYEPNVGGLTMRDGKEVCDARVRILSLAKESLLLADPQVSGNLLATFTTIGGFDAVVKLAYEIRDVIGLEQFQEFQLLYNQNRSAVVLRTSQGEKTLTQQATEEATKKGSDKQVIKKSEEEFGIQLLDVIERAKEDGRTTLGLSCNHMTALPPEIGRLTNLTELYLDGNPLTSPPPNIVEKGTGAVLAYLREA